MNYVAFALSRGKFDIEFEFQYLVRIFYAFLPSTSMQSGSSS